MQLQRDRPGGLSYSRKLAPDLVTRTGGKTAGATDKEDRRRGRIERPPGWPNGKTGGVTGQNVKRATIWPLRG
jgi:hypothetical protein